MSKPPWLTRQTPVLHRSGIVFMATALTQDDWHVYLVDAAGRSYLAEECRPASLNTFSTPRSFINDKGDAAMVQLHPKGLLVTDGKRSKLVRLNTIYGDIGL
jgi:hypothetical protein